MRGRVRLIAAGKLLTPASVAWALGTGADFVNTARGFMFSLGCIQALKCNKNTCPTGITTNQRHLTDALGSAEETRTWLDFARQCNYLAADAHARVSEKYDRVCAMLFKLTRQWT